MKDIKKVKNKIAEMSINEKVAQLCGISLPELLENDTLSLEKCKEKIPYGIGHVCQFGSSTVFLPKQMAAVMNDLQQYVKSHTESKIPILFHEEAISGAAVRGATITPQMIGMSCSWNSDLVMGNARMAAKNLKKLGSYYALSPMMDVITDARWGRGEEGFGEDSYLVSLFALSFIEGLQSEGVAATAKHFAGYGVENQELAFYRNNVLPPFEVAVKLGKVKAVMPGYHAFMGTPCTASPFLLQDILRKEWGFDGVVVSDYGAVRNVKDHHHYAKDCGEAAVQCITAGVDVDFQMGSCYSHLPSAVKRGGIPEAQIDTALSHVLNMKQDLGLLEFADGKAAACSEATELDPPEYRSQARLSAEQSIVLLKNDGILPLKNAVHKIAVVGPNADSYYSLLGDYTWGGIAEFFHKHPASRENPRLITLLDGLKKNFEQDVIRYERGCDWSLSHEDINGSAGGDNREASANKNVLEKIPSTDWNRAISLAEESDVVIAAMGENRFLCGECCNREIIGLPGEQERFVQELCKTGKPVVLIVFGGRPMTIASISEQCSAVLYAWYPGEEGGNALSNILVGRVNPSAKLTVTLPNRQEDVPICYRDKPLNKIMRFPFGYGLSYSQYTYEDLQAPKEVSIDAPYFDICFTVRSMGEWDGIETAQVYLSAVQTHDVRLIGFSRIELQKNMTKQTAIRFYLDTFAKYDADGVLTLSPGKFELQIGASSEDIRLKAKLNIFGTVKTIPGKAHYFSEVIVTN